MSLAKDIITGAFSSLQTSLGITITYSRGVITPVSVVAVPGRTEREYIDENARQFRFSNHSTTDDHGIHIVGYMEKDGKDWYLIKDSGSGSRNGRNPGYYFYNEDYVKLKIMNIMLPKDFAKKVLGRDIK